MPVLVCLASMSLLSELSLPLPLPLPLPPPLADAYQARSFANVSPGICFACPSFHFTVTSALPSMDGSSSGFSA
eukprot:2377505-Pyramimonas_sp.AAC.2